MINNNLIPNKTTFAKFIPYRVVIGSLVATLSLSSCDNTLQHSSNDEATIGITNSRTNNDTNVNGSNVNGSRDSNVDSIKADESGATAEGISQVINANNQFAIDMYQQINTKRQQGGGSAFSDTSNNTFFSPYSLSTAVAMLYTATTGETKQQIEQVFHYPNLDVLNPNSAALYNRFNANNPNYKLATVNDLWIEKQLDPLPSFTQTVTRYYGGQVTNLDFKGNPELSRQTINRRISDHTNQMIPELLPPTSISTDTASVLTNAIYFKGDWEIPFDGSSDRPFYRFDNSTINTPLMYQKGDFGYVEDSMAQVVELPYKGDDLSMLVVLPKSTDVATMNSLIDTLSVEQINTWTNGLKEQAVRLTMPKFTLDEGYQMRSILSDMGMPRAFELNNEFRIFGSGTDDNIVLDDIYHQAVIKVDELGTEAAAATGIVAEVVSVPLTPPIEFTANHPFVFIIKDNATGGILFMGQVNQPEV